MSSRQRRHSPITAIELRITLLEERKPGELPPTTSPKLPRGIAEMFFRSKEPAEVIARAREALVNMGEKSSPKAFKQSRKKL